MKKFYDTGGYSQYVSGGYIDSTKQYSLRITSRLENTRFPEEHRNLIQMTLSKDELRALIDQLEVIAKS